MASFQGHLLRKGRASVRACRPYVLHKVVPSLCDMSSNVSIMFRPKITARLESRRLVGTRSRRSRGHCGRFVVLRLDDGESRFLVRGLGLWVGVEGWLDFDLVFAHQG
jgi:hypothetical protein